MTLIGDGTARMVNRNQRVIRIDIMVATDSRCPVEFNGEKMEVRLVQDDGDYAFLIKKAKSR